MKTKRLTLPAPILIMAMCMAAQAVQLAHAYTINGPQVGRVFIPRSGPPLDVPMAPPQLHGPIVGRFIPSNPMSGGSVGTPQVPFMGPVEPLQQKLIPRPQANHQGQKFFNSPPIHLPFL
ncbi:hypothetical protein F6A13_03570 [Acidithiobacillus sp. 'AMD consortium']|uniref:hypothetical protein n=1 Tax=Acidithiobacillus sp. 'AMD consortium' TaxID=2614801 RepID=UPI00124CB5ED|nr:hypothetical protein [Acidithiobacillus sp. 'AMD consortium']QFG77815.1 hypothetical protein F6A13_03570 [Acidithiobacillus sp. 'AMD consortium']